MGEALKSIKKPSKIQDPRLIKNCFEDVFPGEKKQGNTLRVSSTC
jgi:hypothetical protein